MTEPIRLSPDPSVALAAWRFPSEASPGAFHDVAIMRGDAPDECSERPSGDHIEAGNGQGRVSCKACGLVLHWFTCDCADAIYRERPCKHITRARVLYSAERRTARGGA